MCVFSHEQSDTPPAQEIFISRSFAMLKTTFDWKKTLFDVTELKKSSQRSWSVGGFERSKCLTLRSKFVMYHDITPSGEAIDKEVRSLNLFLMLYREAMPPQVALHRAPQGEFRDLTVIITLQKKTCLFHQIYLVALREQQGLVQSPVPSKFVLGCVPQGDIFPGPEDVHFELHFLPHLLKWLPANSSIQNISYEVEYYKYGDKDWYPVPHCYLTYNLTCDLTVETLPDAVGYFARVRSVYGNQTSDWVRTNRYSAKDVTLYPPSISLDVATNSLIVQLTLPDIHYKNLTRRYEDLFPFFRTYIVHVRRIKDNHTFEQVEDTLRFLITGLAEENEYCVYVQSSVTSRGNIGTPSAENCVWVPKTGLGNDVLTVVASCILAVMAFMIFINIFICFYLRKTVKPPTTLKSLIKRSWSWMDKPASPTTEVKINFKCEKDLHDHLWMESRNSLMRCSADSGFGSQIFTDKCFRPLPVVIKSTRHDSGLSGQEGDLKESETAQNNHVQTLSRQSLEIKEEDSGISLSTDSPILKRSCSTGGTMYGSDVDGSGESCTGILENEKLGYLRQSEKNYQTNSEEIHIANTWHPEAKDYLTQGLQKLNNGLSDPQEHCVDFQGPWAKIPEGFPSSVPLTAAFSPFSRVLWGLGVNHLSLGDVEVMDLRS
ncbi:interleukin-10 receptor subunit alpha [Pelodytes ibericus]